MRGMHEQHLDQIEGQLLEIKELLWDKPDRVDLEHLHNEVVSNLEENHDEMRELKDDVAGLKSQVDDLADADWP